MNKETMENVVSKFKSHLEKRDQLFEEMRDEELIFESLSKKPDVVSYLYSKEHLTKLKEKLNSITDDIGEFALDGNYPAYEGEPFIWIYDYFYVPGLEKDLKDTENFRIKVCRANKYGTHRVYLGVESLKPFDLNREAAREFEAVNDVIVLEEYNNEKYSGLTPEMVQEYRKKYFSEILGNQRAR